MCCRSLVVALSVANELCEVKFHTEALYKYVEVYAPWALATAWGFQHITICDKLQSDDWLRIDIYGPTTE
jgi:hypothetical protein